MKKLQNFKECDEEPVDLQLLWVQSVVEIN